MTLHELELSELSPAQRKHYDLCLTNGTAPKMALMLASRHGPEMKGSDRAFNEGARRKMESMPAVNRKIHELARQAGISTDGKYHVSGLGRYDNPLAWCSTIEDAKLSVKMQGLNATGLFEYTAPEQPPAERVPLAPDLVAAAVSERLSQPEHSKVRTLPPKQRAEAVAALKSQVVSEHGRPHRKRGRGGSPGENVLAAVAESRAGR